MIPCLVIVIGEVDKVLENHRLYHGKTLKSTDAKG